MTFVCFAVTPPAGIQKAFRDRDASLDWFDTIVTKPVNATLSVMLARAAPAGAQSDSTRSRIGLFLLSGNEIQTVIDVFPATEIEGLPDTLRVEENTIYVDFHSNYGFYGGSIRYFRALPADSGPIGIRYGALAMTSSSQSNGQLAYAAVYSQWSQGKLERRRTVVTIQPAPDNADSPAYRIAPAQALQYDVPRHATFRAAGQTLTVENETPPGQSHVISRIRVTTASGSEQSYPVPIPAMAMNRQLLPEKQTPGELENDIGPFAFDGRKIWFANSFYDGEGTSGVGAIGSFDSVTHKYEMRYPPGLAAWSGSALLLDGDEIWVGLMRRPEGANYSGGLLRYNRVTGAVADFKVADVINTIDRTGDTIYCGTSNGLYTIRGSQVRHFTFEPDEKGKLTMVAHPAR
jgi:hypothetical protein